MEPAINPLTLQLLAWIAGQRRTYAETMDAWRSTCPKLSIWEDALGDGLVQVQRGETLQRSVVSLTPRGKEMLARQHSAG